MATRFVFNRPIPRTAARVPHLLGKAESTVRLLVYVAVLGAIGGALLGTIAMTIVSR